MQWKKAVHHYLKQLNGQDVQDVYDLVLSELEAPLLEEVMTYTRGNQTRAAILLGINRGTLRKKLKKYGMNWYWLYPNHLKVQVSVGIKSDLGKALIASNSGSIVKINNAV